MKTQIIIRSHDLKSRAISLVDSLSLDELHEVIIRPYKSKRSLDQNNLYWSWVDKIRIHVADSTGNFFLGDEIHEWLKAKFLPVRVVEIEGVAVKCAATTTKLNTKEMSEYMEMIERFCGSEMGLFLPLPGVIE